MALGNGAYIAHKSLENNIKGYTVYGYRPYLTLFPPVLSLLNRGCKPDLIHTTPEYGIFFQQKNLPMVISFHSFVFDRATQKYSTILQRIHHSTDAYYFVNKILSTVSSITCVSEYIAGLVRKEFGFMGDIRVIYNGIDTHKFFPKNTKRKGKIKVLFCGNLTRRKGVDLLPGIAEQLDDGIEILYTQGLRTKKTILDSPRLRNVGSIPYSEMPKIYQNADILLFPTVREGFGLAAAEAMACGLPVVATNCSSLPELIVHGQGGYLCKLGDVKGFSCRINELAASAKLCREMGEFNRSRVEDEFSMKKMVNGYNEVFEQAVNCN